MKSLLNILLALSATLAYSQTNVLGLHSKRNFTEKSTLQRSKGVWVNNKVSYNKPMMYDEEYCHDLQFTFKDTLAAIAEKQLDITTDTAIVKCSYYFMGVWTSYSGKCTGKITILQWDTEKIELEENIKVVVTDNFAPRGTSAYRFKGKRAFTKNEMPATALVKNRHYKESRIIIADSTFTLNRVVQYTKKKNWFGGATQNRLILTILDTTAAKQKRVLNIKTDTAIVQCQYKYSMFGYTYIAKNVSGLFEIVDWQKDKITVKADIKAYDRIHDVDILYNDTVTYTNKPVDYFILSDYKDGKRVK